MTHTPSAFHERMAVARARLLDFPLELPEDAIAPADAAPARAGDGFKDVTDRWCTEHGFIHDRPVPQEWTDLLRTISPISDEHGWLALTWEAGDPWVECQRYSIYEMVHIKHLKADFERLLARGEAGADDDPRLVELTGPHPRSEGHMCSVHVPDQFQCLCPRKKEAWRSGPCDLITLTQWKLFRQYGMKYFPNPCWIIEGEKGGHQWAFNENERELLALSDLPTEPPVPGSLPYAPFDNRVIEQLMERNRLRQSGLSAEEYRRAMGESGYEKYRVANARAMRKRYLKYLDDQLAEENDLFITAARKGEMDDEQKTDIDFDRLAEAAEAEYVESGRVMDASEVS